MESKSKKKRVIIIFFMVIFVLFLIFAWWVFRSISPTCDQDRINTETDIRMLVDIPGSTPSRAITYTVDRNSNNETLHKRIEIYKKKCMGKIEGDIPAIFTSESPKINMHFQDISYNDVFPDKILNIKADVKNVVTEETRSLSLDYVYDNGNISISFAPDFVLYGEVLEDDWYTCVISIEYIVEDKPLTSITALTLVEDR